MTTVLLLVLIIGATVLASVGGLWVVRRLVSIETLERNNPVADPMYQIVAVLYAVLLAFIVALILGNFDQAARTADHEALELADVHRLAGQYGGEVGQHIQELTTSYAQTVIADEWPLLGDGRSSERAWAVFDDIEDAADRLEPTTPREQILYDQLLTQLHELYANRQLRLLFARGILHPLLWCGLLVFGAAIVAFGWLFGTRNVRAHAAMTAMVAAAITFVLFMAATFDRPFSSDLRVTPVALEAALQRFQALGR
ncbi:MAG TPA: hypothetical protein VHX16_06005 [Chloroflexota bacterium]|nr:hypothetical protein [Chloroflexota bacterium]